jgi:RNA polymerase sigma-70 factor, ECF subfamily
MADELRLRLVELLPRLRRFALSLTGDRDRADDLVQEACVRALTSASQWQPGTRLDSWVYKIAQNLWFDRLRSAKVRGPESDIDDHMHLAGVDGRAVVEQRSTLAVVSKRISELSQDQQLLVGLICVDGLSYKEAADTLGLPIGTVMSRLSRARISLSEAIEASNAAIPSAVRETRAGGAP